MSNQFSSFCKTLHTFLQGQIAKKDNTRQRRTMRNQLAKRKKPHLRKKPYLRKKPHLRKKPRLQYIFKAKPATIAQLLRHYSRQTSYD
jgi:hypothetical protein